MSKYDLIIVGAGPAGLTLAWILGGLVGRKILVIDRESTIGGCHRVRRVDGLFTEHGPRIYSTVYQNFRQIYQEMGGEFGKSFKPYHFSFTKIGQDTIINILTVEEIWWLGIAFLNLVWNPNYGRDQALGEFLKKYNFTVKSRDYLDRICRLTDGAGIERYTLYEFLSLINQNAFYQIVQPTRPNDLGLFNLWEKALRDTGRVDFLMGHQVVELLTDDTRSMIGSVRVKNLKTEQVIKVDAKQFVLAIPPRAIINLLNHESHNQMVRDAFGDLKLMSKWEQEARYFTYIPVIFHWSQKLTLPEKWGFPESDWGLAYIVLSDYMEFDHPSSQTVISTCFSLPEGISKVTGKTAHQSNFNELKSEAWRQLKESFPSLSTPDRIIVSPGVYWNQDKWETRDDSFVLTKAGYWRQQQSNKFKNLYQLGTHNGYHSYDFTSMESAVSNAFKLGSILGGPAAAKQYKSKKPITLIQVILIVLFIIILMMIVIRSIKL